MRLMTETLSQEFYLKKIDNARDVYMYNFISRGAIFEFLEVSQRHLLLEFKFNSSNCFKLIIHNSLFRLTCI